jgi:methylenetetrahydrofolate dehydrogenase (NADP+)/methenyltetrahydrofolate cyclohydrolase
MNDPLHTAPGARIIDGKALSDAVRGSLRARIAASGRRVRLDAILVGDDRAAGIYAMNQAKTCEEVGIEYVLHRLPAGATYDDIAGRVLLLNSEDGVRALMLHLPLPAGIDAERIQSLISPEKDVEGVNPANIGNVVYGRRSLVPCTALASLEMIESTGIELRGKRCAVIGASNIVGKPIAVLLMREEATVHSTNKFTPALPELARECDVIVAACGVPRLVKRDWVKPGAVVIDVGINRNAQGKLQGDVDFEGVREVAGWITPVPGGVGPMTITMLLVNTVQAAEGSLQAA